MRTITAYYEAKETYYEAKETYQRGKKDCGLTHIRTDTSKGTCKDTLKGNAGRLTHIPIDISTLSRPYKHRYFRRVKRNLII
jgi:hypothetical protein